MIPISCHAAQGQIRVCTFHPGKAHESYQHHQPLQEIGMSPICCRAAPG
jgi:hypothetical protein